MALKRGVLYNARMFHRSSPANWLQLRLPCQVKLARFVRWSVVSLVALIGTRQFQIAAAEPCVEFRLSTEVLSMRYRKFADASES